MQPHIEAVRTQSLLTSIYNTLLVKARKQTNFTIMAKLEKEGTKQVYKQSEIDELFGLANTEEGIIILVGKYRVSSKYFKSYKEADAYIEKKPYEILINVTTLLIKLNNEEETKKNADENNQSSKDN